MKALIYLSLALIFIPVRSQLIEHRIEPSLTDEKIDGNNVEHYCYYNPDTESLGKLLLFFPGTTATPWDYRLFQQTSAELGYHSIGLSYENLESINRDLCPATNDSTCHRRARTEVWFGTDYHEALEISYENSIVHRLRKLLIHLRENHSAEGWGQYLVDDTIINWQKIVTAGHSQGAGHATFCSKHFQVERVIMISWIDWMRPGKNPDWITMEGPTPDSAYHGFIHTGDASIYNGIPTTWDNLGMDEYGPITSIDSSQAPFHFTHSLITSMPIDSSETETNYHNCTVVDWMTPLEGDGITPVLKPVWEYLLGKEDFLTQKMEYPSGRDQLSSYPNPVQDVLYFPSLQDKKDFSHSLINLSGEVLFRLENEAAINCSNLDPGVYIIKTREGNIYHTTKIIKN